MIQLDAIHIGYDNEVILRQQGTINLETGKFIALLGANGTGKSTLLRAIATEHDLINGSISLAQVPIQSLEPSLRAKQLAIVHTKKDFNQLLSVQELLNISRAPYTTFLGKLTTIDHSIIEETLRIFDCLTLKNRRLATLSDGQLQRVLMARAMVQDTPYILMDEPSSHLDINHKASLLAILREYCHHKNKCIVFASHELEIALALCDDVLAIQDKKLSLHTRAAFITSEKLNGMFPSNYVSFIKGKAIFKF